MKVLGIRIRLAVFFYATVLSLVLYQTGDTGYGTFFALLSMACTVLSIYIINKPVSFNRSRERTILLVGILYIFVSQVFLGANVTYLFKITAQMLLTWVVFNITITYNEHLFLRRVFQVSMVAYALLIIRASLSVGRIHAQIPLFGTLFDPNFVGLPIVLGSLMLLYDILNSLSNRKFFSLAVFTVGFAICLVAVIQTASRGSLLGLVIGILGMILIFYSARKRSFRLLLLFGMLIVFAIFAYNEISLYFEDYISRMTDFGEGSDNNRFYLWQSSLEQFYKHPFFGAGLGSVSSYYGHESHNTFLQLLSETGMTGLLIFLIFFYGMFRKALKVSKEMFVILVALFAMSFFLNCLTNRCFWALLGWTAMLPNLKYGVGDN